MWKTIYINPRSQHLPLNFEVEDDGVADSIERITTLNFLLNLRPPMYKYHEHLMRK